jgi:hypothetical protein
MRVHVGESIEQGHAPRPTAGWTLIGKGMRCKGCRWEVVVSSLIDRNPMDAGSRTKDWPLWFPAWACSSTPRNCMLPTRKLPIRIVRSWIKSQTLGNLGTQVDSSRGRRLEVLDRRGRRHEVGGTRPTCAAEPGRTADGAGRHPKRKLGARTTILSVRA